MQTKLVLDASGTSVNSLQSLRSNPPNLLSERITTSWSSTSTSTLGKKVDHRGAVVAAAQANSQKLCEYVKNVDVEKEELIIDNARLKEVLLRERVGDFSEVFDSCSQLRMLGVFNAWRAALESLRSERRANDLEKKRKEQRSLLTEEVQELERRLLRVHHDQQTAKDQLRDLQSSSDALRNKIAAAGQREHQLREDLANEDFFFSLMKGVCNLYATKYGTSNGHDANSNRTLQDWQAKQTFADIKSAAERLRTGSVVVAPAGARIVLKREGSPVSRATPSNHTVQRGVSAPSLFAPAQSLPVMLQQPQPHQIVREFRPPPLLGASSPASTCVSSGLNRISPSTTSTPASDTPGASTRVATPCTLKYRDVLYAPGPSGTPKVS